MTTYSLDVLLFLFGTSLLFHVQFYPLLPDLHTGFSRGRSGGLVFPSLSEFPTVYCDPYSQSILTVWFSKYWLTTFWGWERKGRLLGLILAAVPSGILLLWRTGVILSNSSCFSREPLSADTLRAFALPSSFCCPNGDPFC